jgi:mannan endo-1,4-beta-mannosidase
MLSSSVFSQGTKIKPVSPHASQEAAALLKLLYDISGHFTLTGQHSYPNNKGRNYYFAADYIGKTPAIFSTDMGFSEAGDNDSYLSRPDIVKEAIELHKQGVIITLCWHAVPPTADEPVPFRPFPDANPDSLASVQGQLLDQQFKDILTPGTSLYKKWCDQIDTIAVYLKKLQDAHVPVLWRPYHEMNGNWFWWGGRQGEYSTIRLYRQLFDRLVKYHKLNNLIWVWSVDRPNKPEMQFANFYPGNDYLDVLSLDVYGNDFNKTYYNSLLALSKGKPIAFGEVGNPPSSEILENQPKWCYYATWAGMVRNTSKKNYDLLIANPCILNLEDSEYWTAIAPYRSACGLPLLPSIQKKPIDFSGNWIFNEEKSSLENFGASFLPYRLEIAQKGNDLTVKKTFLLEYNDDRITEEKWTLDGKEIQSEFWDAPMITTVNWSSNNDTLIIKSKVIFDRGDQTMEMLTKESWILQPSGKELCIKQWSNSFRGKRDIVMVFDKQ